MLSGVELSEIGQRYRPLKLLGEGGMGSVYEVYDRLTATRVALKQVQAPTDQLLFASRSQSLNLTLALAREFQSLASLRHPNIISVLDYGFSANQQPYFTMELLDENETIVRAGDGKPLAEQVDLLVQTLQALAYLHRRGILHRDLKPGNILVKHGQVKVLDFGLAVQYGEDTEAAGTLSYMAPEILDGAQSSVASDLYAVGVMAFELVAGRLPFQGESITDLVDSIQSDVPQFDLMETAPDLVHIVGRLLDKLPSERYTSADETITALRNAIGEPVEVETEEIRESFLQAARFVGRDAELRLLNDALVDVQEKGKGSAWLVGGESGVGKSRLLDELRIRALVQGMSVLSGQAIAEGGVPYQLWRDALRRLIISTTLTDSDAATLRYIIPDISDLLDRPVPAPPELDGAAMRQKLMNTLASMFRRLSQPTVLILEDLQWSSESLELVRLLIPMTSELPLVIVGNYRDDETPGLPQLLPGMHTIKLNRLTDSDIATLSRAMLGEAGGQSNVIELLQRETEGNVFFLVEVVRTLAEEAGQLAEIGRKTLPEQVFAGGMQRIIERRLNRVPPAYYPLLQIAAVAGRQIDPALLHVIDPAISVDEWLVACANSAVLQVQENRWRFAHDKLREGLLSSLVPDQRRALHHRVADAIEAIADDPGQQAAILAYHYGAAGDAAKECDYSLLAAEQELAISAYRDAGHHLGRAWGLLSAMDTPVPPETLASLLRQFGEVYVGLSRYREAEWLFNRSRSIAEDGGSLRGTMDALQSLGELANTFGDYPTAQKYLEQSLSLARQLGADKNRVQALNFLARIIGNAGNFDGAINYLEESLGMARASGDKAAIAFTLRTLGKVKNDQELFHESIPIFEEGLTMAVEVGDRYEVARANNAVGIAKVLLGDYTEGKAHYQASLSIFREIGERWGVTMMLNNLGFVNLFLDEYDEATENFYSALRSCAELRAVPIALEVLVGIARLMIRDGYDEPALELFSLALNHPSTFTDVRALSAEPMAALAKKLSPDVFQQALERGKALDFNQTVSDLLKR